MLLMINKTPTAKHTFWQYTIYAELLYTLSCRFDIGEAFPEIIDPVRHEATQPVVTVAF